MVASEVKPGGKTGEEVSSSVLALFKQKLPRLLSKWRRSRATLVAEAMEAELSPEELEIFLKGFRRGYWNGAADVETLNPGGLNYSLEKLH